MRAGRLPADFRRLPGAPQLGHVSEKHIHLKGRHLYLGIRRLLQAALFLILVISLSAFVFSLEGMGLKAAVLSGALLLLSICAERHTHKVEKSGAQKDPKVVKRDRDRRASCIFIGLMAIVHIALITVKESFDWGTVSLIAGLIALVVVGLTLLREKS